MIQQLTVTLVIIFVAFLQPYRKKFINSVDVLIFINLAILNCFSLYLFVYYKIYPLQEEGYHILIFSIQYFLICLPGLYMLTYILWQWKCLRNAILNLVIGMKNRFNLSYSPKYQNIHSVVTTDRDNSPEIFGFSSTKSFGFSDSHNAMDVMWR